MQSWASSQIEFARLAYARGHGQRFQFARREGDF
jgi:hypothetical protein